jgi:MFS superfamily sulfate permease-like transporter
VRWLCLDASAIDDVDYSAAETIRSVHAKLKAKGIQLVVGEVMEDLKGKTRYQFKELLGADAFYDHLEDVVKQYRQQFNLPVPPKHHA